MCALYLHCVALLKDTLQQVSSLAPTIPIPIPKGPKGQPVDSINNNLNLSLNSTANQIALDKLQKVRDVFVFLLICRIHSLYYSFSSFFSFLPSFTSLHSLNLRCYDPIVFKCARVKYPISLMDLVWYFSMSSYLILYVLLYPLLHIYFRLHIVTVCTISPVYRPTRLLHKSLLTLIDLTVDQTPYLFT